MTDGRRPEPRYVFVVGAARSGTTLLQSMLATHSRAAALYETDFFNVVARLLPADRQAPETPFPREGFEMLARKASKEGIRIQAEALARECAGLDCRSVFVHLARTFSNRPSDVVVAKTPTHVYHIRLMRRFFPDSRVIGIVRHPVEVVGSRASIRAKGVGLLWDEGFKPYRLLASFWREQNQAFVDADDEAVAWVRYEDLVADPEGVLIRSCRHAGLSYETPMSRSFGDTAREYLNVEAAHWKRQNLSNEIVDHRVYWKKRLSPGSVWIIETEAGPLLERFGYERSPAPPWPRRCLALAREALALAGMRARRRLIARR